MTHPALETQQAVQYPPIPKSNVGWAVAAVVFFWPLAFVAFSSALQVFPRWYSGDFDGARAASSRARICGIISLCIGVGLFVLCVASA